MTEKIQILNWIVMNENLRWKFDNENDGLSVIQINNGSKLNKDSSNFCQITSLAKNVSTDHNMQK